MEKLGNPLLENIRVKGWLLAFHWFVTIKMETSRILTPPTPMDFLNIDPDLVAVKLYFTEVRMILTGMKCPRRCDN